MSFDPKIAENQLLALNKFNANWQLPDLCGITIMILTKEDFAGKKFTSKLIPFVLNRIQYDLWDKKSNRNIVLKPRQIGSTTYHILCRLLLPAIIKKGHSGLLISQNKLYGAQHFRILQRAVEHFGESLALDTVYGGNPNYNQKGMRSLLRPKLLREHLLHTKYSARHEILFDYLDSKVLVESAENKDAGTGLTLNALVCTEVAYWPGDPESLLAQAKETVPKDGTIDLESTPNGMGGYFFEEWQRSEDKYAEFNRRFYPWWWQTEYQKDPPVREEELTDDEERRRKEFGWTLKQIAWRREKMISLRTKFQEKYPEDSQSCFLLSSRDLFFDQDILREIKMRVMNERPIDSFHDGSLKIYRRRIPGRRYLIGADVAEGRLISTDNPDNSAAVVIDVDTGEEMAAYCSRQPPEEFAHDLVDLAEMYNRAMIAPERNGPGGSVLLEITRNCLYGNVYMHKEWFKAKKEVIPVAGFPTNQRTRPMAVNRLGAMIREFPDFWHDENAVDEMFTFVWASSNRNDLFGKRVPQGARGTKDDRVMCRAIAAYVREVLAGRLDPIEEATEGYGFTGEPEELAS